MLDRELFKDKELDQVAVDICVQDETSHGADTVIRKNKHGASETQNEVDRYMNEPENY